MRGLFASALTLALLAQPCLGVKQAVAGQPGPGRRSCKAELQTLSKLWNAAAYPVPSKPSQARVLGRNGFETTGESLNSMRARIGLAAQECANGFEAASLEHVADLEALLARHERGSDASASLTETPAALLVAGQSR